jgi:hypothetical protein
MLIVDHSALQTPAIENPFEGIAHQVSEHFILVIAMGGMWLRVPRGVSRGIFGIVDGVVHIFFR